MAGEIITKFDDHELRVSRFLEQWRDKPDLVAWLKTYLDQLQDVEDALFEIILERNLDDAIGVQLTILGDLVQQPRTTSVDADFRTAIRARIVINLSDGTPEDMIKLMGLLLTAGERFKPIEEPPAQQRIVLLDPTTVNVNLIASLLDEADLAGVRTLLQYATAAEASGFVFGDTGGAAVIGKGWDHTAAGADAGVLSGVAE